MRRLLLLFVLVQAVVLAGCGDRSPAASTPPPTASATTSVEQLKASVREWYRMYGDDLGRVIGDTQALASVSGSPSALRDACARFEVNLAAAQKHPDLPDAELARLWRETLGYYVDGARYCNDMPRASASFRLAAASLQKMTDRVKQITGT